MSDIPESQDDLASDLFGSALYEFDKPKAKGFLPWHRPRKQFVRDKQWVQQILAMIDENEPESQIIRYLGLPGDDLLDLRHFHDKICVPKNLKLRFLGFNKGMNAGSDHKSDLEISLDEINRLAFVEISSELLGDDFTKIALNNSIARERSIKMGPFDVINIDLCDGFAKQPVNDFKETHYNTLHNLMTLQARRMNPWLLLLTTRTDSDCIDAGVFERFKQIYLDNLVECAQFSDTSSEKFAVTDEGTLTDYCATDIGFANVFLTSLCKWILKIGIGQNPPAKVEVKSVLAYKVGDDNPLPNLVSLALKITPTLDAAPDLIGLANQVAQPIDECVMASRALVRVFNQKDVDKILDEDADLRNEMITSTANLLQQARYDPEQYQSWLNGQN